MANKTLSKKGPPLTAPHLLDSGFDSLGSMQSSDASSERSSSSSFGSTASYPSSLGFGGSSSLGSPASDLSTSFNSSDLDNTIMPEESGSDSQMTKDFLPPLMPEDSRSSSLLTRPEKTEFLPPLTPNKDYATSSKDSPPIKKIRNNSFTPPSPSKSAKTKKTKKISTSTPKKQSSGEEETIGEIIALSFPVLHALKAKLPFSPKSLSKAMGNLRSNVEESFEGLLDLINRGFYPKAVLQHLYDAHMIPDSADFQTAIQRLKSKRQVCLAPNKDRDQKIFKNCHVWYYVPFLVTGLCHNANIIEGNLEDYCLGFKVASNSIMPWLVSLLFEFCTASSVVIGDSVSRGSAGKLVISITLDSRNSKMKFFAADQATREHCLIVMLSIIDVINQSPVLRKLLTLQEISYSNMRGRGFVLTRESLQRQCDQIMLKMENEMKHRAIADGEQNGLTQNLMKPSKIEAHPEAEMIRSEPATQETVRESLSNISNLLPVDLSAGTTEPETDKPQNPDEENVSSILIESATHISSNQPRLAGNFARTSNATQITSNQPIFSANLGQTSNTFASTPIQSSDRTEAQLEDSDQESSGSTSQEMAMIMKFMKDPSLAYLAEDTNADDQIPIFGNAVLIKFDAVRKRGLILTANHVYEESKKRGMVKVHFPNAISSTPFAISGLKRAFPTEEHDVALLLIKSIDPQNSQLEPISFDLPEEFWWQNWKKLFLVGYSITRSPEIVSINTSYTPRIIKAISQMIDNGNFGDLNDVWQELAPVQKERLQERARRQLALIELPGNNVNDKSEATNLLTQMVESARRNSRVGNFHETVVQQLLKLLDPRRFVMENGGGRCGQSGSIIFSPSHDVGAVGMFLCGYPNPLNDDFLARHFTLLQGVKLGSLDLNL